MERGGELGLKLKENLSQWFFKITNYAEELNDLDKLDLWPKR